MGRERLGLLISPYPPVQTRTLSSASGVCPTARRSCPPAFWPFKTPLKHQLWENNWKFPPL